MFLIIMIILNYNRTCFEGSKNDMNTRKVPKMDA